MSRRRSCLADDGSPGPEHAIGVRVPVCQCERFVRLPAQVPEQCTVDVIVIDCSRHVVVEGVPGDKSRHRRRSVSTRPHRPGPACQSCLRRIRFQLCMTCPICRLLKVSARYRGNRCAEHRVIEAIRQRVAKSLPDAPASCGLAG